MPADPVVAAPPLLRVPATPDERIACLLASTAGDCVAIAPGTRIRLVRGRGRRQPGRPQAYTLVGVTTGAGRAVQIEAHTLDEALTQANAILAVARRANA